MIYLTTGANGAGKTLFTLKDVRERQLKENRPVYHNGRFALKAEFGWKQIDFKDWQSVEDGAIFLIDECHNDVPLRRSGSEVPEHIKMLAEHRRRGFDFYMITQHPSNLDVFVRRIIGPPGWHRHLKNFAGSPLVSHAYYTAANVDCEKPGASDSGEVKMLARPKEVFDWYESATLHTAKPKIPKAAFVLGAVLLVVPLLGYLAYSTFSGSSFMRAANGAKTPSSVVADANPLLAPVASPAPVKRDQAMTASDIASSYIPAIPGLPHTAPRYAELTKPEDAPYPAACVMSKTVCKCYSQQATPLDVAFDLCKQIVNFGFFKDWGNAPQMVSAQTVTLKPGT